MLQNHTTAPTVQTIQIIQESSEDVLSKVTTPNSHVSNTTMAPQPVKLVFLVMSLSTEDVFRILVQPVITKDMVNVFKTQQDAPSTVILLNVLNVLMDIHWLLVSVTELL